MDAQSDPDLVRCQDCGQLLKRADAVNNYGSWFHPDCWDGLEDTAIADEPAVCRRADDVDRIYLESEMI